MLLNIIILSMIINFVHGAPEYILTRTIKGDITQNRVHNFINKKINGKANIGNTEYLFASNLTASELRSLSQTYVIEMNHKARVNWHLDRIDQRNLPLSGTTYSIKHNNSNIDMYIVDSGIEINHEEFANNNIMWGANFIDDINTDCSGHGTHVASLAGGRRFGVAKNINLIALKVLGCEGWGWYSGIISSIEWAINRAKTTKRISVINMSLGGPISQALNDIIKQARIAGLYVIVAAGNENKDACTYSPASVKEAITVAASESNDNRATFSNYGSCVDVYAPGVNLLAAWTGNRYARLSGTSMASPVAAGVLSVYLSKWGRLSGYKMFLGNLTSKVIKFNPKLTANRMVYIT